MTSTRYVRPLKAADPAEAALIGTKAAALAELCSAGFLVPDGYVVTTDALEYALRYNDLDDSPTQQQVAALTIPPEIAETIEGIERALEGAAAAVRSSAVDEDLADCSYAGQYESVLGVVGIDALQAAVRTSWASAFADRVPRYAVGRGKTGGSSRIAVLVQRMVNAEAAGVAFSADPITGDRSRARVSAVRGLGARLADGRCTPDEWSVREGSAVQESGHEHAITTEQAVAVATLARLVAAHCGAPQDIEWAIGEGRIWLLQARPITSLPESRIDSADVPAGHWQRSMNSQQPLSPMQRSQIVPALNASVRHFLAYSLAGRIEFRVIGGWLYSRRLPPGREEMQSRVDRIVADAQADKPGMILQRWHSEWLPDLTARIGQLSECDCDRELLTDKQLAEHLHAAQSLRDDAVDAHFQVIGAQTFILGEFGVFCTEQLGTQPYAVFALLAGLPSKTTEPTYRLAALTKMAAARPALREQLQQVDDTTAVRLADIDAEFAEAFRRYQVDYGQRTMGFDIAEPTMAERPTFVLQRIAGQLISGYDADAEACAAAAARAAAVGQARTALVNASKDSRERFEWVLRRAQQAYPLREDTDFVRHQAEARVRYAVLELGRRLAERGAIPDRDDVFGLERDEALAGLQGGGQWRAVVAERAEELTRARANPGPASYGEAPQAPPQSDKWIANLPPQGHHALSAAMWTWQALRTEQQGAVRDTAGLVGTGASAGRYTGPARIITSEAEFGKLHHGDVLVCPEVSPQWSVLFPGIGALITNTGGLLSHPAIIAREYRIPAVLGTANATQILRDGQLVTVDGSTGRVEVSDTTQ